MSRRTVVIVAPALVVLPACLAWFGFSALNAALIVFGPVVILSVIGGLVWLGTRMSDKDVEVSRRRGELEVRSVEGGRR